jgi:hypothetical protein
MRLLLADVLAISVALALLAAWTLQLVAGPRLATAQRSAWVLRQLSMWLLAVFVLAMSLRSLDFGVDTAAYAEFFDEFCRRGPQRGVELSYRLSALWLDAGMAGQCSVPLLPGVWAVLIVGCLLCVAAPLPARAERQRLRWSFTALTMFSMVGVELVTNALRQGLSVAVMLLAISFWPRQRLVATAFALAAVGLHSSAALVLLACAGARLPWRIFLAALAGTVLYLGMLALQADEVPAWLEPLLFEITKYLAHDDDEIWVRVLAFTALLGSLIVVRLSAADRRSRRALRLDPAWGQALRLSVTCLPLLAVPYFGYRYIYGVYPVVLYLCLLAAARSGIPPTRLYFRIFVVNAAVLLAWAHGSSSMQEVPFFD